MNPTKPSRTEVAWIAIVAVGAAALVASRLAGMDAPATVAKMTASSGFVALAVVVGALRRRYGQLLLAGLVFSWWGDLFLAGESGSWFLAGLVSFLLAHVTYILAFASLGVHGRRLLVAAVPVALVSMAVIAWLTPHVPQGLQWPVRAYTLVITAMVVTAMGARGAGASALIPAGALLFYCSDLSVAAGQFLDPAFPNYVWGLPMYYGGQVLLALSIRAAAERPDN